MKKGTPKVKEIKTETPETVETDIVANETENVAGQSEEVSETSDTAETVEGQPKSNMQSQYKVYEKKRKIQ